MDWPTAFGADVSQTGDAGADEQANEDEPRMDEQKIHHFFPSA